jgi:hypothetical protein
MSYVYENRRFVINARKDFAKIVSTMWKSNGITDTLFPMISVSPLNCLAARQEIGEDLLPSIGGMER